MGHVSARMHPSQTSVQVFVPRLTTLRCPACTFMFLSILPTFHLPGKTGCAAPHLYKSTRPALRSDKCCRCQLSTTAWLGLPHVSLLPAHLQDKSGCNRRVAVQFCRGWRKAQCALGMGTCTSPTGAPLCWPGHSMLPGAYTALQHSFLREPAWPCIKCIGASAGWRSVQYVSAFVEQHQSIGAPARQTLYSLTQLFTLLCACT